MCLVEQSYHKRAFLVSELNRGPILQVQFLIIWFLLMFHHRFAIAI